MKRVTSTSNGMIQNLFSKGTEDALEERLHVLEKTAFRIPAQTLAVLAFSAPKCSVSVGSGKTTDRFSLIIWLVQQIYEYALHTYCCCGAVRRLLCYVVPS